MQAVIKYILSNPQINNDKRVPNTEIPRPIHKYFIFCLPIFKILNFRFYLYLMIWSERAILMRSDLVYWLFLLGNEIKMV